MQGFTTKDPNYEVSFGLLEAVEDAACPGHSPLLKAYRDAMLPLSYAGLRFKLSARIRRGGITLSPEGIPLPTLTWELVLVKKESVPNHIGTGRILNADWMDISIINRWRDRCRDLHGPKCGHAMQQVPLPTGPAWLIDVENKCLVPGSSDKRFIALSYRLGRYPGFIMNAEKVAKFQQPHSISDAEFWRNIPPTIRHAMWLTSAIGERYLWTDILCIVHGDVAATATQLKLMSAIYANAVLTIVAADGDAQEGLPGLRDISTPRNLNQPVIPFGDNEQIALRDTNLLLEPVMYHRRGWTYQEYAMSPKKVIFFEKQLHWECEYAAWHEDLTPGTSIPRPPVPRLQVLLAGFPEFDSLAKVISSFNTRDLAYDQDALPAITGLLSVLSRPFTGGFLYGLPEMFFDRALGWYPDSSGNKRRTARTLPNASTNNENTTSALPESALPSWSWIGWQGEVKWRVSEASRINDSAGPIAETFPVTEWYTSSTPRGRPMRRVRSTWFENRDALKDHSRPLPSGWTRHEGRAYTKTDTRPKGVEYNYPEGCGGHYYKHRNLTYRERQGVGSHLLDAWFYPIPVADMEQPAPDSSSPFTMPEQTPYLFCKTNRTFLWSRRQKGYGFLFIVDKSDKRVGNLYVQARGEYTTFPFPLGGVVEGEADTDGPGRPVELVAINRQKVYATGYDKEQDVYFDTPTVHETYTVLWVEWSEGVAYRRGVGSVEARDWEESKLEEITLILG
jgi:hypothetical protein